MNLKHFICKLPYKIYNRTYFLQILKYLLELSNFLAGDNHRGSSLVFEVTVAEKKVLT